MGIIGIRGLIGGWCDGGRWAMGIRGLIGGCVMAGDGHNRLNMPNRRVVRWRVVRWRVV